MRNFTPAWFKKGFFNESLFCDDFLSSHQLLYSNGAFFTPDGRMVDPMPLRCEIFEMMREYVGASLAKKVTNVVDARLLAFSNGDLQALYDRSDGFYRRQLILTTKDKPLSRVDDPDIAEKMAAEVEGILLWAFEGLQRLVKNGFQFTESDRAKRNRELVKRDNNNVFDFLESEGYIRLKADACTSSKELYEVYRMWCEENSLNAIKARGFSDALIANQRRYNLESTNNIVNSSGRRVRGFVGIEALVQPDLTPNGWRA
ncbi:primase-like DNA-binding domain-containing protein [Faecalibacterium sp.]|uniref:primase-like DNA-binding domain-containing protein n=1 Tax=Faecalibacterium sp. TaxID=1971605 RepID=UPI0039920C24